MREHWELTQLVSRYFHSLDDGDAFDDAWASSLFTEDAVLAFPVGTHEGVAGLAAFTAAIMGRWARTQHHATDHLITLGTDHADVSWNVSATHVHLPEADSTQHFHLGGRFDGEAVRGPAGWRFRRLTLRVTWTAGRPAAGVRVPPTLHSQEK